MQTKESNIVHEGEIKDFLKKLHCQRRKWRHDNKNALCWSFYYVNDNKPMDVKCSQLMRCILCYASLFVISNTKTQVRKGLILYNSANGITTSKKHV